MPNQKPVSLKALASKLETLWSPFQNKVKGWRLLYNKEFKSLFPNGLPEGVPIHGCSTARSLVDNLADQIRTDEPRVLFKAVGTTKVEEKNKELMELWGTNVLRELPRHTIIDPMEQAKKDLLKDSVAVLKYTIDMGAVPPAPDTSSSKALKAWRRDRAASWYFDVRSVDPLQVYPAPGRRSPPAFILEKQRRLAYEVRQDYPTWGDPKAPKRGPDDVLRLVDWLEYWSPEYYIVEVDGERIIDKENPYGAVPYEWCWNGLGRHDVSGSLALLGESILEATSGEFVEEVRLKTAMAAQWQFHVFPRLITTLAAAQARKQFMKGPGAIITVTDMAQAPKWLEVAPPNPAMYQFLQEIRNSITARFPQAINQRPPGVEAAIHQALLQGQAVKPLQPVKVALNRMFGNLLNGMLRQMRALDLDSSVVGPVGGKASRERMVTPQDIKAYNFEVSFEATDPANDDRRLLTGLALLRVPRILSRKSFREKFAAALGIKHQEEEEQILEETTLDQISDQGLLTQAVMEEFQAMEAEEQAGEMAEVAGQQAKRAAKQFVPGARERMMGGLGAGVGGEAKAQANQTLAEVGP